MVVLSPQSSPQMPRILDQTLKLTISVPGDINEECVEKIVFYLKSIVRFQYTVLEFSQKWHLHSCLCLDTPKDRNNLKRTVWKIVERYHKDADFKWAVRFDCLYNNDWYDTYLQKSESTRVIENTWDSVKVCDYYPSPEDQAKRLEYSAVKELRSGLTKQLDEWKKSSFQKTRVGAFQFLMDVNLRSTTEMPAFNERRLRERSLYLWRMLHHYTLPLNTDLIQDDITFQSDPSNPDRQIHVPPEAPKYSFVVGNPGDKFPN